WHLEGRLRQYHYAHCHLFRSTAPGESPRHGEIQPVTATGTDGSRGPARPAAATGGERGSRAPSAGRVCSVTPALGRCGSTPGGTTALIVRDSGQLLGEPPTGLAAHRPIVAVW